MSLNSYDIAYNNLKKYLEKDILLYARQRNYDFGPEKTNNVYVYGEVSSEGAVMYSPNEDVEHFISKSGGLKRFADTESIYILHPNGETEKYSKRKNLFANQPQTINLYPGSIIFVPKKLDNSATRRLATQAYVSILGNLGVALASLSAINDN